jgi:hypothetical protein
MALFSGQTRQSVGMAFVISGKIGSKASLVVIFLPEEIKFFIGMGSESRVYPKAACIDTYCSRVIKKHP